MRKAQSATLESSPHKFAAKDLETLRKTFRALCQRYAERVDGEMAALLEKVLAAEKIVSEQTERPRNQTVAAAQLSQVHDLRDMLMLLRSVEVKPDASRRKDLKKIETLVEDLRLLTARWK
jgi:hypothetical protein